MTTRETVAEPAKRRITNCHAHTFTHEHSPDRFVPWPIVPLTNFGPFRRLFIALAQRFSSKRGTVERYAEIVETSYAVGQAGVFEKLQGSYPEGTRFVVLPMDMTFMNAGRVEKSIDDQHEELAKLRDHFNDLVIPFAAVDPRHGEVIVAKTIWLLEEKRFRGIKLYPPTGYHPNDPVLWPLYEYAEEHGVPVLTHCSRPASVQYRGAPTAEMRRNPAGGEPFADSRYQLLTRFTDPDAYIPILEKHPKLRICLAHFGGAGDWDSYLKHPWESGMDASKKSWLATILDMIRCGRFPNLWTDIAYTLFADDEYAYLLKVLLSDERILARTLFGSDFYVVESAMLEERRRAVHVRAVLGEDVFWRIAETNPAAFLGDPSQRPTEAGEEEETREFPRQD
jgi:predicted TIM-barrel fold metal-dependent hydrolase